MYINVANEKTVPCLISSSITAFNQTEYISHAKIGCSGREVTSNIIELAIFILIHS